MPSAHAAHLQSPCSTPANAPGCRSKLPSEWARKAAPCSPSYRRRWKRHHSSRASPHNARSQEKTLILSVPQEQRPRLTGGRHTLRSQRRGLGREIRLWFFLLPLPPPVLALVFRPDRLRE